MWFERRSASCMHWLYRGCKHYGLPYLATRNVCSSHSGCWIAVVLDGCVKWFVAGHLIGRDLWIGFDRITKKWPIVQNQSALSQERNKLSFCPQWLYMFHYKLEKWLSELQPWHIPFPAMSNNVIVWYTMLANRSIYQYIFKFMDFFFFMGT